MRRRIGSALAVLAVSGVLAGLPACGSPSVADPPSELVITAGESSGVYYPYALGLAAALSGALPDTEVSVADSGGSVQNLERLDQGSATIAFSLADSAALAVDGSAPFASALDLAAIARLYTNSIHVVVPADSPIETVADLAGKRISLGPAGSGTEVTARRMLAVSGVVADQTSTWTTLGLAESAQALRAGSIDAFFWSGGLPTPTIADLSAQLAIRLLATDDILEDMRADYGGFYVEQAIPDTAYGLDGDVSTIGIPNLLLVRADLPADLVRRITEVLFDSRPELIAAHPEARYLDRRAAITTAPVPLHPGARAYYQAAQP